MKQIKLTQGQFTLVDDEDYGLLIRYKWHTYFCKNAKTFYVKGINQIRMHRLILGITDKNILVDHKDHNGLNNQRHNLRIATRSQNGANRRSVIKSTSKYLGVSLDRKKNTWYAQISYHNRIIGLGRFKTETEAALAYNQAAKKLHGEFSNLNII